jgi:hypothetical protein
MPVFLSTWLDLAEGKEQQIQRQKNFVMALEPVLDDEGSKFHCEGEDLYRRTTELMQAPDNSRARIRDTGGLLFESLSSVPKSW